MSRIDAPRRTPIHRELDDGRQGEGGSHTGLVDHDERARPDRADKAGVGDVGQVGGPCLSAGAKLESAMNAYSASSSRWNDCIYDYGCDVDSIDPFLQAKWAAAGRYIDKAEQLMDRLDPANGGGSGGDQT